MMKMTVTRTSFHVNEMKLGVENGTNTAVSSERRAKLCDRAMWTVMAS